MIHRLAVTLLSVTAAVFPAFACSENNASPIKSDEEIAIGTEQRIRESDVILDATVAVGREGVVILKPIRIWKGPKFSHYYVLDGCDVALAGGSKVRVLLQKVDLDESGPVWSIIPPMVGQSWTTRHFDNIVDAHLGNSRPRNYESGGLPHPPMP